LCNRLERFVVLRSVRYCACLPRSTLPLPSSHLNSVHLQPLRHSPSDLTASFVHWAVSVPPLASPHQDPRSPCQRIRQPTPPGRQFSPTGILVPACPRLFPRPRPKQGKVKKKKLVFFLSVSRITTHPTTLFLVSPHPSLYSSRFSRLFPCACFGNWL